MSVEVRGPSVVPVQIGPEVGGPSDCRDNPTGTAGGGLATELGCPLADSEDRFPVICCPVEPMTIVAAHSVETQLLVPPRGYDCDNQTFHTHNIRDSYLYHGLGVTLRGLDVV